MSHYYDSFEDEVLDLGIQEQIGKMTCLSLNWVQDINNYCCTVVEWGFD